MSITDKVASYIRNVFKKEHEQKREETVSIGAEDYNIFLQYGFNSLSDYLKLDQDLLSRYGDYEEMDEYADLSSGLDIFADDTTTPDTERNQSIWIEGEDENIVNNLNEMMHKKVRIEDILWEVTRTACKYGNDFEEILVNDEGVQGLAFLPPATARRISDNRGELLGFTQSLSGRVDIDLNILKDGLPGGSYRDESSNSVLFEPWKVVHFRLRSKNRGGNHGISIMEPARWVWKRLVLMEDSMLIYKLTRAPSRYAFYVDIGDMPPKEGLAYVNKIRAQYKKRKFVNQNGKLDMRHNPLSSDDDFFVPTRSGKESTRIDVLSGPSYQSIEDVDYMRMKLYAAMKIPRAYLGYEDTISRSTLAQEDVRFCRSVLRIQRVVKAGFKQVCRVDLAIKGLDPSSIDFEVFMNVPSSVFESAQMEIKVARAELAERMGEWASNRWIMENIFGWSNLEIERMLKQRTQDELRKAVIDGRVEKIRMGQIPPELAGLIGQPETGMEQQPEEEQEENKKRAVNAIQDGNHDKLYKVIEEQFLKNDKTMKKVSKDEVNEIIKSNRILNSKITELKHLMNEIKDATRTR